MYSSKVQPIHDLHSGILGPIVIVDPTYVISSYQKSVAYPCDVNNEMFLLSGVFSESHSWYLKYNLEHSLPALKYDIIRTNSSFITANKKYSLNGFMYGNLNSNIGNIIPINSLVRVYVISISTDSESREINFEGNQIINSQNIKSNVIEVTANGYSVGDMETSSITGTWTISSQTSNDMKFGMTSTYSVTKDSTKQNDNNELSAGGIVGITIMMIVLSGCFCFCYYRCSKSSSTDNSIRRNADIDACFGDCSTHSIDSATDDTNFLNNNNNNKNNNKNAFPLNFNIKQMNFNNSILQKTIEKLNQNNNGNNNNKNNNNHNNLFTITNNSDHNDGNYSEDEDYVQNPLQVSQQRNQSETSRSISDNSQSHDSNLQVIHLSPLEISSATYQSRPLMSSNRSTTGDPLRSSQYDNKNLSLYNGIQEQKNSAFSIDSSEDRL